MSIVRSFLLCVFILSSSSSLIAQRIRWEQISNSKPGQGLHVLNDSIFLSLISSGDGPFTATLYRTTDAGNTWTGSIPWGEAYFDGQGRPKGVTVTDLHFFDEREGVAFGGLDLKPMLYVTSDGGYHWSQISPKPEQLDNWPYLLYLSSDSSEVYFYASGYSGDQREIFKLNRSTRICTSIFESADLKLLGFEYFTSIRRDKGVEYVLGIGVNKDLRLMYRVLPDTTWSSSIQIDSTGNKSSQLIELDGKLAVIAHHNILTLSTPPVTFDTLANFPARIIDFDQLTNNILIAVLEAPPFIMAKTSGSAWTAQGYPALVPFRVEAGDTSFYHYNGHGSGASIIKGNLDSSARPPVQLYLPPYRREVSLSSYNSEYSTATPLLNYADSITASLFSRSQNILEFDRTSVSLGPNSFDSIRIKIKGTHPGIETAIIMAVTREDTIVLAEWKIIVPAPLLRTSDTIRLSRLYKKRDSHYRIPLHNIGQDTLAVTSLTSNDKTLVWQGTVKIRPNGIVFLNLPETVIPTESGWFMVESNSPLSTDTLYYRLDATSLRPALRHVVPFKNASSSLDLSIKRMTVHGSTTYVASQTESDSGNRSISVFRNSETDQFFPILELDGTKTTGTDELLSFGNTGNALSAIAKLSNTIATSQYYYTFDTSGVIQKVDSISGSIEHAFQSGSHFHLRLQYPSSREEIGGRTIEHGSFSLVKNERRSGELHGAGSYDSHFIGSNGDAFCTLSASDSTGHLYLIGRQDRGYGSYYDKGVYYDTVLVSSRGLGLKGRDLFGDQLEVTHNGKLFVRNGQIVRSFGLDGRNLFEKSYDPVAITTIHTGASENGYVGKQGPFITLLRLNDSGSVSVTYTYSSATYINHQIRDVQILRNDHAYVLINDGLDIALLHFDSSGVLLNSVHLDGGYLTGDSPVQFIRTDSQAIIALNTKNELGNDEGVLYYFDWQHPILAPTKRIERISQVEAALNVYPNPASRSAIIEGVSSSLSLHVIDVLGVDWSHTIDNRQIDVSQLPVGIYTVVAGSSRSKLVVRR